MERLLKVRSTKMSEEAGDHQLLSDQIPSPDPLADIDHDSDDFYEEESPTAFFENSLKG